MKCFQCVAWDENDPEERTGLCRRRAPLPFDDSTLSDDPCEPLAWWPLTGREEWCCEFIPRTTMSFTKDERDVFNAVGRKP